jgi:hypothetical protein
MLDMLSGKTPKHGTARPLTLFRRSVRLRLGSHFALLNHHDFDLSRHRVENRK